VSKCRRIDGQADGADSGRTRRALLERLGSKEVDGSESFAFRSAASRVALRCRTWRRVTHTGPSP
jgi:hypothetical protein